MTDIVILVVAANDGVKPQTVESIKHIKAAKVPLIVAINKMDLPGASADTVKAQLTEHEIFVEGYGGQTPTVEVSALKKQGLDQLLEMIVLVAELEEIKSSEKASLEAVVIESHVDKRRGPMATLIVKNGCMSLGEDIYDKETRHKARAMFDDLGEKIFQAKPGDPVQVLGFKSPPEAGSVITSLPVSPDQKQEKVDTPIPAPKDDADKAADEEILEDDKDEEANKKVEPINLIVKSDTVGTLEAILASIMQEEIALVHSGVGPISESDILLAQAVGATIVGFNVGITPSGKKLAQMEKVQPKLFNIIYELIEYIEEKVLALIEPSINEEEMGTAKVLAIFDIRGDKIAGCEVTSGKVEKSHLIHLERKDQNIADTKIKSLKQGKKDVKTAKKGTECGMVLDQEVDIKVGDVLKYYRIIKE